MASGCEKEETLLLEPSLGPGWAGSREKCFLGTHVSGMEMLLSKGGNLKAVLAVCGSTPEPFASGREQGSGLGKKQMAPS